MSGISHCPIGRLLLGIKIIESGCWEWQKAIITGGYGVLRVTKHKSIRTHRYAYEVCTGLSIPDGMQIDHLCRNRKCCNPEHLEVVTPKVNSLRGISPPAQHAKITHCIHGHPFDDKNTYKLPNGGRMCKQCSKNRKAESIRKGYSQVLNPKSHKYVLINTIKGIIISHHPRSNTPYHHIEIKK